MPIRTRRTRRQGRGQFRLHKPRWIDPYPGIPGTEPEKRVFAALIQRKIYFIYQGQVPEFEKGSPMYFLAPPNYKPDFVLPEYRLVIDPFSPFHHSFPLAAKRDAQKIARYAAAGYAYYHPWAIGSGIWTWDQRHDVVNPKANKYRKLDRKVHGRSLGTLEMLQMIPELVRGPIYPLTDPRDIAAKKNPGYRFGQYLTYGPDGKLVSPGATSVAAANKKRRRPPLLSLRVGHRRNVRRAGTRR